MERNSQYAWVIGATEDIRQALEGHLKEAEAEIAALTAALEVLGGNDRPPRTRSRTGKASERQARTKRRHRRPGPRQALPVDDGEHTAAALPADVGEQATPERQERESEPAQPVSDDLWSWPARPEAQRWAQELAKLSPVQRAKLRRFVDQEIEKRRQGRRAGFSLNPNRGTPTPSSQRLIDAGFVGLKEGHLELTDRGRAAGRLLASRRESATPPWWHDVVAPLLDQPD